LGYRGLRWVVKDQGGRWLILAKMIFYTALYSGSCLSMKKRNNA